MTGAFAFDKGREAGGVLEFDDPDDPGRRWRFDREFLESNWTCIWGRGCVGILDEPAEQLGHGCCSVGAELLDEDEERLIDALAATLDPTLFQHHATARDEGVFAPVRSAAGARMTRVVDGACVFLNRSGFEGGSGCALHLAALAEGEEPLEWKPSVCWQLPVKVERSQADGDVEISTVRRWERRDWGRDGESMAWLCTDPSEQEADAFVGDERVIESLEPELMALLGRAVFVELTARLRS